MEFKTYLIEQLIKDISMGPFGSDLKKEVYQSSGIPVLNGSNLIGFKLKEDSFGYVSEEKANQLKKCNALRGDIVVTHRGTLGQIVYIPYDSIFDRYLISQSQFRFTCNDTLVIPEYLVYYFHTKIGQYKLLSNASQVGVPALARATSTFKKIKIDIPPVCYQIEVMNILSSLDAKIETNNKLNEKLEEMAQAIFKSWFVDFEPFKNQPFYETELGMIPEGWEIINLKEIVEENPKSKIKVSDARDNKGPYPFFTSGKSILRYDDYLVDNFNVFLNTGGVADIKFYIGKANYSTDTWCIRGKEKCSTFLFYYLKNILEEINFKYFEGSALKHLQKKKLLERKIIFPSTYIMKEYLEIVNPLLIQQSMQSKQSQSLASLRDTLLPRLMSGEIKI